MTYVQYVIYGLYGLRTGTTTEVVWFVSAISLCYLLTLLCLNQVEKKCFVKKKVVL